jgi:hypothetical protein
LVEYTLPPYGIYPKGGNGCSKIGQLETIAIESFWKGVAESAKLDIRLCKICGDNGMDTTLSSHCSRRFREPRETIWMIQICGTRTVPTMSPVSIGLKREAKVERSTKETTNGESKQASSRPAIK